MRNDVDELPDFILPDVPRWWDAQHFREYGYYIPYHMRIDRQVPVEEFKKKMYKVPIVVIDLEENERLEFESVTQAIVELKVSARLSVVVRKVGLYKDKYLCYRLSQESEITPEILQYYRELVSIKKAFSK